MASNPNQPTPTPTSPLPSQTHQTPSLRRTASLEAAEGLIQLSNSLPSPAVASEPTRSIQIAAQALIKLLQSSSDEPTASTPGYHAIEAIIGERVCAATGRTQFCVAWAGEWPESVKLQWLDEGDCLGSDIVAFRTQVAELEVAAGGFEEEEEKLRERLRAVEEKMALDLARVREARERSVSASDETVDVTMVDAGSAASGHADGANAGADGTSASGFNVDGMDLGIDGVPSIEVPEEDAEYEEISMEEWISLV